MIVFLRILGGFLVAVTTSLVVHRLYQKYGNDLLKPLARPDQAAAEFRTALSLQADRDSARVRLRRLEQRRK